MKSPNFLDFWFKKEKRSFRVVLSSFLLILLFASLVWVASPLVAVIIFFVISLGVLAVRLEWGVYFLAAVAFFQGLEINFANFTWTRDFPFLSSINAPIVDLFAVFLMLSFGIAWLFKIIDLRNKKFIKNFPGIIWYGLFLLSALVSVFFIYNNLFSVGIKYWLRPMLFVYLAFIFIPRQLIRKTTTVYKVVDLWVFVGFIVALFGFSSLLFVESDTWIRLIPYTVFGVAPLGINQNLLAEVLVVIFPFSLFLYLTKTKKHKKVLFGFISVVILAAALLTLSRAGWIALSAEFLFFLFFIREKVVSVWKSRSSAVKMFFIVFLGVVFLYMGLFLRSTIVSSSTTSRAEALNVAIFYSLRQPWFGYGPGMFKYVLTDTAIFVLEFGDPLDAHGVIQKILVEEGVIGLFFFAGFILSILWRLWQKQHKTKFLRKRKLLYQTLFVSVFGILLFQLFSTSYFNAIVWLPMGFALAATTKLKR